MKKIITGQNTMKHKSSKEVNLADVDYSRKSPKRKRKKTKTANSRSISKV